MSDATQVISAAQYPANEPSSLVPAVLSDAKSIPTVTGCTTSCWWVLHTRARNEKAVARDLTRAHIEHYLPLFQVRRPRSRRPQPTTLPLFPGYVFLYGCEQARAYALRTNRVANVLSVPDQPQFEHELRQIYRVVESGTPVDLHPGLQEGSRCRITTGGLSGVEGVVVQRCNVSRVHLAATFLGQSAVIEVDTSWVELLD